MGGLSNFKDVIDFFSSKNYKVVIPELPIYTLPLKETSVTAFSDFLEDFVKFKKLNNPILLGNSLGGHIGLIFSNKNPNLVKSLVLTGSSGLYENSMGESYPKRENYNYIKRKTEEVFYNPKVATKVIVDEVFETVNDRDKLVRTLAIAKSAIRHNMSSDLPNIKTPTLLIWGENDLVTPPEVAIEFNSLLPNSELIWMKKCGHAPMMEHPKEFNRILFNWLDPKKNSI
ncbi:MAG: alpha/beta hydrolase [Flavobacteriales bacterium]|nr:MAG: alpha/beta hydrolase [Flavobacteriales bacterium TMED96]RZP12253.1 MAG: alpha/beta hydrolase [Flavobacteriales bacterium]